jgi:hypothetical protein
MREATLFFSEFELLEEERGQAHLPYLRGRNGSSNMRRYLSRFCEDSSLSGCGELLSSGVILFCGWSNVGGKDPGFTGKMKA